MTLDERLEFGPFIDRMSAEFERGRARSAAILARVEYASRRTAKNRKRLVKALSRFESADARVHVLGPVVEP